ncbi:hypothetical protein EMIHUDRAFT_454785 [Emiliania huxleyi CCMP1516]|uniref:Uncharacterized protein n=2 Tax=Emiliania huxleyi TaxID=2903 RepID=A0A0D3KPV4_EMIH1|nr:hypothetical protein EMIHUDRAFT_454785 [Emiliania huxleyi CCMP1516]EOD37789.1 hypothetical protein EMIHUDRAFT_454785 [Emiliania huxleyi CCMP1516]|eukprot:XP_005790218.1 hypothetical protein EMIHUDRAFT_454785 [Emiliania huxleyi CCMP1516]
MLGFARRGAAVRRLATVADSSLKVNFIFEKHKKRVTVAGMVGWTLLETAKHHGLPLHGARADSPWDYVTLGEGPGSVEDHIVLPVADFEKVGPCSWQEQELLDASAADHVQPNSRLASCVVLTKEMDGLTALVPASNADLSSYM